MADGLDAAKVRLVIGSWRVFLTKAIPKTSPLVWATNPT